MNRSVWNKRKAGRLLATGMLMGVLAVPAAGSTGAAQWKQIELDRTDCSVTLNMSFTDPATQATEKLTDGAVSIFLVAKADANDNGYFFNTSVGQFAGNAVLTKEALENLEPSDQLTNIPNNARISETLASGLTSAGALQTKTIGSDGTVSFGTDGAISLTPGLYLMVQTTASSNSYVFTPFLISIPDKDGNYQVVSNPKPGIVPGGEKPTEPPETETETEEETKPPKKEKQTEKPTEKPTEKQTETENKLPQTGQLWWPVPFLAVLGVVLLAAGMLRKRNTK